MQRFAAPWTDFVNGSRSQWEQLVRIAQNTPTDNIRSTAKILAKAAGMGPQGIEIRLKSVRYAMEQGLADAQILGMGQEVTVSRYVRGKRSERVDGLVCLRWMVAPELRDDVHKQAARIKKVLGLTTSDQFWEFMLSQMMQWEPAEILHSAGTLTDAPNKDKAHR